MSSMRAAICGILLWLVSTLGSADTLPVAPAFVVFPADDLNVRLFRQCVTEGRCPNIAKAMQNGAVFRNAHTPYSLCCPATTTLYVGMNPSNHGVRGNDAEHHGGYLVFLERGLANRTVAAALHASGIEAIAHFGKFLNERQRGARPLPWYEVWESVESVDPDWMSSAHFAITHTDGRVTYHRNNQPNLTDYLIDSAAAYIRGADRTKKMYVEVAPFAPHAPAEPPLRYASACTGVALWRPPSFNTLPSDATSDLTTLPPLQDWEIRNLEDFHRRAMCSTMALDDGFGVLVDALEERGGSWMLAFTSDNGNSLGPHRLDGKTTYFWEDTAVPLLLIGPGVPTLQSEKLVTLADIAPTILTHLKVPIPHWVDGRALQTLLAHPDAPWRKAMQLVRYSLEQQERRILTPLVYAGMAHFRGIRTERGVVYVEFQNGEKALYRDPSIDPYQEHNVVKAHPELAEALSRWIGPIHQCSGSDCIAAEDHPPNAARIAAHLQP